MKSSTIGASSVFLHKKYCFANEHEARVSFSNLLSQASADDVEQFDAILSTLFSVRQDLFHLMNKSVSKKRPVTLGLPDICISANEDYVIPALSAQRIRCCMEIRQYQLDEIPVGMPRIHAYLLIKVREVEFIVDVDADPFYGENVGVVVSPEKSELYSSGILLHRRWVTEEGHIERFECYTKESRSYLIGEGIAYLSLRNYFLESDVNQCPIVLSPFSMGYFSYSAGWMGAIRRDWIKLILVANNQQNNLLWNITFDNLHTVEIQCTETKYLRLTFLDQTDFLISLDDYGYPLEGEMIRYTPQETDAVHVVNYSFRSSPTSNILLPSPFNGNEYLSRK